MDGGSGSVGYRRGREVNRHLGDLVDRGVLLKTDDGRYVPDPTRAYFDRLRELILTNERLELRDELQSIAERIEEWQATYDVESVEEVEATLADDRSPEEVRERRRAIRRWETSVESQEAIRTALMLYDDVQSLTEGVSETLGIDTARYAGTAPMFGVWRPARWKLLRRVHDRLANTSGCTAVRYEPSRRDANRVVAEVDPSAFLEREYPAPEARLRVEFALDGDRPQYWIQWWEPGTGRGVCWHCDDTEPSYGPVHLQIEHPDGRTERRAAEHVLDEHPYRTFERLLERIGETLADGEWD